MTGCARGYTLRGCNRAIRPGATRLGVLSRRDLIGDGRRQFSNIAITHWRRQFQAVPHFTQRKLNRWQRHIIVSQPVQRSSRVY